jgi:hypothetical protein
VDKGRLEGVFPAAAFFSTCNHKQALIISQLKLNI